MEKLEEALMAYAPEYAALKKEFGDTKKGSGGKAAGGGPKVPAELQAGSEEYRSADALAEFLIANGLEEYASKLILNGYDDVDVLLAMTDAQVGFGTFI